MHWIKFNKLQNLYSLHNGHSSILKNFQRFDTVKLKQPNIHLTWAE